LLFNSYEFLLVFLPITFFGFFALGHARQPRLAILFLAAASLFFYAYWNPRYLPHLLISIGVNFSLGLLLTRERLKPQSKTALLTAGIILNLAALSYFKYSAFFLNNLTALTGHPFQFVAPALPLAISFFTFTQIAYLVDTSAGRNNGYGFLDYTLFVTTFPHLIAGPIVHHGQLMPQFKSENFSRLNSKNIAIGLSVLAVGLVKKVIFADQLATISDPIFAIAAKNGIPSIAEAWSGGLAYVLQLYFDFSGYSDMAIGLGLIFNLRLPINFASPYQATNISDLWRRWHITLTEFLREYLYTPLALSGARRGSTLSPYYAILLTMVIAGLWHGAGWTYILFGFLMGILLVGHRVWQIIQRRLQIDKQLAANSFARFVAWGLTFFCVVNLWIIFRSESVRASGLFISGLLHVNSPGFAGLRPDLGFSIKTVALTVVPLLGVVLFLPSVSWWISDFENGLPLDKKLRFDFPRLRRFRWSPNIGWALVAGASILASLIALSNGEAVRFIYFQF
jgi:alginate O-acetyltransferase complex protein AlgI